MVGVIALGPLLSFPITSLIVGALSPWAPAGEKTTISASAATPATHKHFFMQRSPNEVRPPRPPSRDRRRKAPSRGADANRPPVRAGEFPRAHISSKDFPNPCQSPPKSALWYSHGMDPLETRLKRQASELGFDLAGIVAATEADGFGRLT